MSITDPDSDAFVEACRQNRLSLQCCDGCGRHRFPPMPSCPWCGDTESTLADATGRGHIYSWVTVRRALSAEQVDDVPYTIATVTLDEGCRMFGRLVSAEPVDAEMPVEAVYVDHGEHTEIRFRVLTP